MSLIGNILWLIFGGLAVAAEYATAGVAACATIIGIPFGLQLFKLAVMSLVPFGQSVAKFNPPVLPGCVNAFFNIVWVITGGLIIAATHLFFGVILCITIIGIPFGMQHFKLMKLAFWPFGRKPM